MSCFFKSALLLVFLATAGTAHAQTHIETQPLALAFRGVSVGALHQVGHVKFGGGFYFFSFPDFFVDQSPGNANEGWNVTVSPAFWLEGNYQFQEDGTGLGLGANVVYSNFQITQDTAPGRAQYQALVFIPKVTYTWVFFSHLVVSPGLGLELHAKVGGNTTVGTNDFEPLRLQPLPILSVGYRF
ncbi:MAG TPA: hypothetical protein VFZ09_37630 [Archangium sp.]|uniref:hypothetical protein n=1 Tax=Archangium sp. TaxID=1872627 RepID=UPI002E367C18|nr:hypothetical protein [Archangium sp.]HEX5752002.1 hypothetical protein [Archangium sp.]